MSETNKALVVPDELLQVQQLANLSDTAIRLPIVGIRLGLDFLLGLIPVVGDGIMLLISFRIIHLAKRMGAPESLLKKMARNCVLDFGIGLVPLIGDLVDIFFKANKANARMLEQWWLNNNRSQLDAQTQSLVQEKLESLD